MVVRAQKAITIFFVTRFYALMDRVALAQLV